MKNCRHCKYAEWGRTKAGSLHRSGEGRCTKQVDIPKLPGAFYYVQPPFIGGGFINRKRDLLEHCPYYARDPEAP